MIASPKRSRVLSGHRPTGPLHLGHLVGALENWVHLQDEHDCFFAICDWHALTSEYSRKSPLREWTEVVAAEWLAAGIDPERATLFVQSDVKEHAELHLLLSMLVPLPWLERVPTFKEQQQQLSDRDLNTYGFLGYPVLQSADILIYRAHLVPVGEDQVAHIEFTREVARRFNSLYGEVFPEPTARLTETARLPGTDGRKMSKSYGNSINLGDEPAKIREKIARMVTDPARVRRSDPGNPDVCPVFTIHQAFTGQKQRDEIDQGCRTAAIGCLDCKKILSDRVLERIAPLQARRAELVGDRKKLAGILAAGADRARQVAGETMKEVRERMLGRT
ncbi:MAG: tryptophan--tRNA ligase [Acidobacteriota bacterium]|nr:tryptophan--tRNA ligase [Acidobacteriota bacterium]